MRTPGRAPSEKSQTPGLKLIANFEVAALGDEPTPRHRRAQCVAVHIRNGPNRLGVGLADGYLSTRQRNFDRSEVGGGYGP